MSENTSLLQRLTQLGSALGNAFDQMVEAAKAQSGTAGEAAPSNTRKTGFSARALDGSSLNDLTELADRLREKSKAPPVMRRNLQAEVFEEAQQVIVLINQPGLQVANLVVALDGDMLELSAEQDGSNFAGEVLLPCAVDKDSLSMSARSGVLELRWEKLLIKEKKSGKAKPKRAAANADPAGGH